MYTLIFVYIYTYTCICIQGNIRLSTSGGGNKIIGLFYKKALLKRLYSAKETCDATSYIKTPVSYIAAST